MISFAFIIFGIMLLFLLIINMMSYFYYGATPKNITKRKSNITNKKSSFNFKEKLLFFRWNAFKIFSLKSFPQKKDYPKFSKFTDKDDSSVSEEHVCKVYGNYQNEYSNVLESLDIDFGLKEATREKCWTNNYKVVEFLSDYFSTFLEIDNNRITDFRHNIKYIVNELLENAIKFNSHKDYEIKLKVNLVNETIFINICNSTPVISLPRLESLINDILTEDTMELYIKRIEESLEEENTSGLGLLTIINDYGAELSWKIESLDKNDLLLIDTMVKLNI